MAIQVTPANELVSTFGNTHMTPPDIIPARSGAHRGMRA